MSTKGCKTMNLSEFLLWNRSKEPDYKVAEFLEISKSGLSHLAKKDITPTLLTALKISLISSGNVSLVELLQEHEQAELIKIYCKLKNENFNIMDYEFENLLQSLKKRF
jgi:hypothetical protein